MVKNSFKFKAKIWLYPGMAAWHFVTLPKKLSKDIKNFFGGMGRGFGSLPVSITIGNTTWKSSIFPDKKAGAYLLPLKSAVRKAENLKSGQTVEINIQILT